MFVPSIALELREKINSVFYEGRVIPRHTETQHFYEDVTDNEIYASVTTKCALLSRDYYKQMAADKAVDHIVENIPRFSKMEPEEITEVFSYAREAHKHDLKRAGDFGTHGHDLVDRYVTEWIKTGSRPTDIKALVTPEISNEGVCAGLSAVKFFDEFTLFPIVSERKVLSKKHKYAGTLDSLFLVGEVYKGRVGEPRCNHWWFEKSGGKIKCDACKREEQLVLSLLDWKTSNQIFGVGSMSKFDYAMQVAAYSMAIKEMTKLTCKKHWIVRLDKKTPSYEIGVIADIKKAGKAFLAINEVSNYARSPQPPIEPLFKKQVITL